MELPPEERLELAQALWESLSPPQFELMPDLAALLDERLKDAKEHPEAGVSWPEAKAQILSRK